MNIQNLNYILKFFEIIKIVIYDRKIFSYFDDFPCARFIRNRVPGKGIRNLAYCRR